MNRAKLAAQFLVANIKFHTVLDIGCGLGQHTKFFSDAGKAVTPIDIAHKPFDNFILGDYNKTVLNEKFDLIWCCHVLEHQLNVDTFLKKVINDCKDDGYIAITVPPMKPQIVGGHVNLFNTGLLLYRMILAGLDLSKAHVNTYGYDCSVITRKVLISDMPNLLYDQGDIELLRKYFPIPVHQGFDGNTIKCNWG